VAVIELKRHCTQLAPLVVEQKQEAPVIPEQGVNGVVVDEPSAVVEHRLFLDQLHSLDDVGAVDVHDACSCLDELRPARLHGCAACDADARLFSRRARRAGPGRNHRRGRFALRERRSLARSVRERRSGELEALRTADPELVEEDSAALGAALGRVPDALTDGGQGPGRRAQPDKRAAVLGLTGQIVGPIPRGAGVLLVADDHGFRLETLD
jgi:hypothetical protein